MPTARTLLRLVLRFDGVVLCLAILAVPMSDAWMAGIHQAVGLGEIPRVPLVGYLTRSISGLYFLRGLLVLFVSFDLRRYLPVIVLLGLGNVLFGVFVLVLDLVVGMPTLWALAEGPPVAVIGAVIVGLAARVAREEKSGAVGGG